jgi:CHAT domain-containing protein
LYNFLKRRSYLVSYIMFVCVSLQSACAQQRFSQNQPLVKRGLVVESLIRDQEGEKAGIRPGDVLLRWSRGKAAGNFEFPFQIFYLKNEQASRGPLTITGIRGSAKKVWVLGADNWGVWMRPNFQGDLFVLYEQGRQRAEGKKSDEAVELWRRGAALARVSEPPWVAAWLLLHAALIVGPHEDSYEHLMQEAIVQAADADPVVRGDIYLQWAYGFLARNDLAATQDCFEKAAKEWQKLGTETLAVSAALASAGWAARQYGNVAKAEEYYREASRISQKIAPDSTVALFNLTEAGNIFEYRGDVASAELYYQRALAVAEHRHLHDRSVARILSSLALLDHRRGNLPAAEIRYRQALVVLKDIDPNGLELAAGFSELAECLIDKGDIQTAERYEARALRIRQSVSPGSLAVAFSFRNLGKIARVRKDWDIAESYYRQALAIGNALAPVSESMWRFLIGLGYVARDRDQNDQAEAYFRQALGIIERLRPASLDHAETLADIAGALYHRQQLEGAEKLYQQALAELENKSFALGGEEEDRSRFRASHLPYYKEYVDLLVDQGRADRAFEQWEASRARTLVEMLARSQINISHGVDASLLTKDRDLRQSISRKLQDRSRLVERNQQGQQLASVDGEIATLREKYERLQTEIRTASPSYAALIKPQPLSVPNLQQLLDPETVLLEYSVGEERSLVWAVTNKSVDVYALPGRSEIEGPARAMYSAIIARARRTATASAVQLGTWERADATFRKSASRLSRMILDPAARHLAGKRLVIVPDEILQYIPFSALPAPGNEGAPLIAEHEIVTLPSLSIVAEIRRAREGHTSASREVAVLADPVFDSDDARIARPGPAPGATQVPSGLLAGFGKRALTPDLLRSADDLHLHRNGKAYFGRLIFTRREAQAVMAVTPPGKAMAALDFKANRALASSAVLSEYRIVHFATHGLLNNTHPELSGLVFSLVDEHGHPRNGFLKLQEIYNLNLPVEMVVLSGCDTGVGQQIRGEGLISLTRGFMYSGASRVVASLWSVDDRATANLMADFYEAMERDGMGPAAALRAAQIKMLKRERWSSPYYWAAFQIQGEWQ